eukprot:CAMPEP_0172869394 /NCGR_PEP_ID=MMETSP1075-20121228/88918_1 /TAXON_ID=2916 /ORGANISM="Ceratium fusus, Strain PA161109" /LENGTH=53 /DNA_ID=CAMNT_0013719285 /DNA_START=13 /DNA_END=171 /DNA_ORIENTATION=-
MTHHPAQDLLQAEAKAAKKTSMAEKEDAEMGMEMSAKANEARAGSGGSSTISG